MGSQKITREKEKFKPTILAENNYSKANLDKLKKNKIWKTKDIYINQLKELFEISNAELIGTESYNTKLKEFIEKKTTPKAELRGNYVYYPYNGMLLHLLNEKEFHSLRTNRTRNLVNEKEQAKLGLFTAGVAGLSFGNGIALALSYSGISNTIKIADKDIFETTNLNRVRVGLSSVGEHKTVVTANEIYGINPYANVEVFADGLDENNITSFVKGNNKLNIIFDVVDDFSMKVRLRLAAKEARIPVVMLTSLEDSILVDVERFDQNPEAEIFHGLLGTAIKDMLTRKMTEQEKAKYAMMIVGSEHVSYRNMLSLSQIGKSLVSRPHLYGTVTIVCGLAAYIAKRIALKEDMPSMRKHVLFSEILNILPNKEDTVEARDEILRKLITRSEE